MSFVGIGKSLLPRAICGDWEIPPTACHLSGLGDFSYGMPFVRIGRSLLPRAICRDWEIPPTACRLSGSGDFSYRMSFIGIGRSLLPHVICRDREIPPTACHLSESGDPSYREVRMNPLFATLSISLTAVPKPSSSRIFSPSAEAFSAIDLEEIVWRIRRANLPAVISQR